MLAMLTLEEYAAREGISYSAACERKKAGTIKTQEKYVQQTVTKRIKRIYVMDEDVKP